MEVTAVGLGIIATKPKSPEYATVEKRHESFHRTDRRWPSSTPVSVDSMIDAGLVYTGTDSVLCGHLF